MQSKKAKEYKTRKNYKADTAEPTYMLDSNTDGPATNKTLSYQ